MTMQEEIDKIRKITSDAMHTTPQHIRGLLIPSIHVSEFFWLIEYLIKKAKLSEKYFEQIQKSAKESNEANIDFINTLSKKIKEGEVVFK